jgi:hypothetical protein
LTPPPAGPCEQDGMTSKKTDAQRKRNNEALKKKYAEDPEFRQSVLDYKKAHWAAHKTEINAARRLKHKNNPDKAKDSHLKKYGITLADYNAMLAQQNRACAICPRQSSRTLAVDHCHVTGRVRRLLCNRCNVGLGNFDDDPVLVLSAAAYLLPYQDEQQEARLRAWAAGSAASALRAIFLPPAGQVRCEIIMSAETGSFRLQAGDARMALQAPQAAKPRRRSRPPE